MINAMATVTAAHGLWTQDGGMEYNLCIAVVALGIAAIGPGRSPWTAPSAGGRAAGARPPSPVPRRHGSAIVQALRVVP